MQVVTEVAPRAWPVRAGRRAVGLAGSVLILAALILAVPASVLLVMTPWAALSGEEVTPGVWASLGGSTVAAVVLFRLGLRLARGRRHLVLFLRRFGFDDASQTLTIAVHGAMGRRWRLVTLDDAEIEAVGVDRSARIAWRAGRWTALALLVVAVGYGASWWLGGGVGRIAKGTFDSAFESAKASGQDAFAALVVASVVSLLVGAVVLSLLALLAITVVTTLGVGSLGLWRGDRAVRRAEGAKTLHVSDPSQVARTVDRIRGHAGRIQAPRLVVLKVHDAIWRDVVRELAGDASVALIDVSEPTEHLLWEVALLQGTAGARMLPVGRRDRVEALPLAKDDAPAGRLHSMLARESVLVYEAAQGRPGARRFARNLAAALDRMDVRGGRR